MLSVQTAGCAGMERLGVPIRSSINSPTEDRHITRKMRMDAIHARDLLVRDAAAILNDRQVRTQNKHYHRNGSNNTGCNCINIENNYCGMEKGNNCSMHQQQFGSNDGNHNFNNRNNNNTNNNSNCNSNSNSNNINCSKRNKKFPQDFSSTQESDQNNLQNPQNPQQQQQSQQSQQQQQQTKIRCPHHVPLPDGEWGHDRDLQIRARYQTSEITRSYIKAPPNKTVLDVPDQRSNFNACTGINLSSHQNTDIPHQIYQNNPPLQQKNKPNVIQKFFSRKTHSGHYNTNLYNNSNQNATTKASQQQQQQQQCPSSSSLSSASSSSSSLSSSSVALPISSALTSTNCNYGKAQQQQNQLNDKIHDSNSNLNTLQNMDSTLINNETKLIKIPLQTENLNKQRQQQQLQQQQQLSASNLPITTPTTNQILNQISNNKIQYNQLIPNKTIKTNYVNQPINQPSIDCNYYQATSRIVNYDNNTTTSSIIQSSTSTSLTSLTSSDISIGSSTNLIKTDDKNCI